MQDFYRKLDKRYGFRILREPERLSGGFTHRMYALDTAKGKYAIKLLNPFVMKRETAMDNFARAERLEEVLAEHGIKILPALFLEGRKMQEIDGQYFYLFDYFDGRALTQEEITEDHCRQMGAALAAIHKIDPRKGAAPSGVMRIDWDFYMTGLEKENRALFELMRESYPLILDSQEKGNAARKKLPPISAICHNDMDCKNVLWRGEEYRIIDLECLTYNNPMMELFELALCWSGYEACAIDLSLTRAFLAGYSEAGGELPRDWEVLYDCNNGRLEWLEYNIKRVLGIDCGAEEKEMGISQVEETLRHIVYYHSAREEILRYCTSCYR